MVFICPVTLQDHEMKTLYDWLEPIKVSDHSSKFGGHTHYVSEDIMVLNCHMISQYHQLIKGHMTL